MHNRLLKVNNLTHFHLKALKRKLCILLFVIGDDELLNHRLFSQGELKLRHFNNRLLLVAIAVALFKYQRDNRSGIVLINEINNHGIIPLDIN